MKNIYLKRYCVCNNKFLILRFFARLFLIFYIFFFVSCQSKSSEYILRVPISQMPLTFDPIMSSERFTQIVNRNIFETLLVRENSEFNSSIADYWHNTSDQHTVIRIKENVRFSDGYLLSLDDVIASLYRANNHPKSIYKDYVVIDSIVAQDRNYVYIYNRSLDRIIPFLSFAPIYKKQHLDLFDDQYLSESPVSTGVYYLYSSNDRELILKRNKYHRDYDRSKRENNVEIVRIFYEPSLDNQFSLLKANAADLLLQTPFSAYRELSFYDNYEVVYQQSNSFIYMMLDTQSNTASDVVIYPRNKSKSNPFKDKRVRLALAYAIDINHFVQYTLMGKANVIVIPSLFFARNYPYEMRYYPYDLNMSKELMKEAGFEHGFEMRLKVKDGLFCNELALYIQKSLQNINIKVNIDVLSSHGFDDQLSNSIASAVLAEYEVEHNENLKETLYNFYYHTHEKNGKQNIFKNTHQIVNTMIDSLNTLSEYDRRSINIFHQLSRVLYQEAMVIPFINPYEVLVYRNDNSFVYRENFLFTDFRMRK